MIEILLHHHCSKAAFTRADAPAYPETLEKLIELNLLEKIEFGFIQTTERGSAFVDMVLSTPLPEVGFYDPRSGRIVSRTARQEKGE